MFGLLKKSPYQIAELMHPTILECKFRMEEENPLGLTHESIEQCRFIICSSVFWSLLGQFALSTNDSDSERTFKAGAILTMTLIDNFQPLSNTPASEIIVLEDEKNLLYQSNEREATFGEIFPKLISQRQIKLQQDLISGAILVQEGHSFALLIPAVQTFVKQVTGNDDFDDGGRLAVSIGLKWMQLNEAAIRATK